MKSSKGLEALNKLIINWGLQLNPQWEKDIENELKALEIIKEKNVDIFTFKIAGCLERYNEKRMFGSSLTQEEYDLLKEVML